MSAYETSASAAATPVRRLRLVGGELLQSQARLLLRDSAQIAGVLQLLQGANFDVESAAARDFVDRYYDTADWALYDAGWSLRWRDASGAAALGLRRLMTRRERSAEKGAVPFSSADSAKRDGPRPFSLAAVLPAVQPCEEVKQPVERDCPLAELPVGPVTGRIRALAASAEFRELFRAHHYRRVYSLRRGETLVEMALGEVTITCPSPSKHALGQLRFDELVLTPKQGGSEALAELATKLERALHLVPARLTVFERGFKAAGLKPPAACPTPLGPGDLAIGLAYRHLESQLQEVRAEEPRAWEGLDPEGVHQMRVATRRLRAAFRAFAAVLPSRPIASFNSEFRWLAGVLGAVRDLDVQQAGLERQTATMPADDAGCLEQYRRHLADQWRRARRQLLTSLDSVRYRQLCERFAAFLDRGPTQAGTRLTRDITVGVAAAQFVDEQLKRVLRRGRRLAVDSSNEQYHDLRIQCKRLRYLFEFFSSVYGEALAPFVRRLKQLQEVLGELQDSHVATVHLREYAEQVPVRARSRRLLISVGQLISAERGCAAASRAEFHRVWKEFAEPGLRRRIRKALGAEPRTDAA